MSITIREDIAYGEPAPSAFERAMDLYLPDPSRAREAAVIVVHGGGWMSQDRKGRRERSIATDLATAGFVAASVDYTLVDLDDPKGSADAWPRMFTDCVDAVGYLNTHAGEFGIGRVGAIGGSAGGHLAAMLAVATVDDGGSVIDTPAVGAAVVLYGVGDLHHWLRRADDARLAKSAARIMFGGTPEEATAAYRAASPVHYASRSSSPMLLFHGERDELIDAQESVHFQDCLERAGASSELIIVPDAPHSFDLHPERLDIEDRVVMFFAEHLMRVVGA